MTKKWTKPVVAATLGIAGVFPLALDSAAQALDPLSPQDGHENFQLVLMSTASGGALMVQDMITGDPVEVPRPWSWSSPAKLRKV